MGTSQLSIHGLATTLSVPQKFNLSSSSSTDNSSRHKIRAVSTVPNSEFVVTDEEKESNEPSAVDFAFVHVCSKCQCMYLLNMDLQIYRKFIRYRLGQVSYMFGHKYRLYIPDITCR
ncbi:hypothetical protein V6N13_015901 [Hibiscus sabdariffa]|uniref:Uncharacterized protein n=1 Tax=Hibiscus sabdariffa TaxID=183260 RepID=A0ABR2CX39_9ROSI